jgi:hypothetical protein
MSGPRKIPTRIRGQGSGTARFAVGKARRKVRQERRSYRSELWNGSNDSKEGLLDGC